MKKLFLAVALIFGLASCGNSYIAPRKETILLNVGFNGFCSGVVLAPNVVLTASHCAENPISTNDIQGEVFFNGNRENIDLALVRFKEGTACPCVKLAAYEARIDEEVIVVGFPLGLIQVLTEGKSQGIVPIKGPTFFGEIVEYGPRLVLTASVDGGNSGGGVFVKRDGEWQLVGILVQKTDTLALAIPLADVKNFLNEAGIKYEHAVEETYEAP